MCGIIGIVRSGGAVVSLDELKPLTDALAHRGPDGEGHFMAPGVGLGMRRLKIIDLETGDQPISNEDGNVWTIFNGEIYNFRQLRDSLVGRGHSFKTSSDTEVIVHAYEEYGDAFVERLRGMFALAVWDQRRRRLLLARDRLGKKPLVYAERVGELVFASELQALVMAAPIRGTLDHGALADYLSYGYVPAPSTIYPGARKLPPGHVLIWEEGRVSTSQYWEPRYEPKHRWSESDALDHLERTLDEAVRLRMIADVPIGALLSGGVDSSLVVALMAKHSTGRVKTFSIGFEDTAYDELSHARRVAERYDTDHHEFVVRPDAAAVLPQLVRHYGEPFADSSAIPTFYVSQLARSHVTVALNGDGGDESFAGYDRVRAMRMASGLQSWPGSGPLIAFSAHLMSLPLGTGRLRGRTRRFLEAAQLDDVARYSMWISTIKPGLLRELVAPDMYAIMARERSRAVECALDRYSSLGPVDRLLATDVATYLPGDLLVKMDIASMSNSLETRSPLLDHEVVELAAQLPEHFKLGPKGAQKWLLKTLARKFVPPENLDRPKMGFGVPVGAWLRSELRELAEDALLGHRARSRGYFRSGAVERLWREHQTHAVDRTLPLWTLLMLELWHRQFAD